MCYQPIIGSIVFGLILRRERSTYNHGHALLVGSLGKSLEVGDVVLGVANALDVDGLGLVVDSTGKILGFVAVDELGLNTQAGQEDLELVVGTAV